MAGQIDMMIGDPITAHAAGARRHAQDLRRRLRARGCPSAPEVPTVDEAGLPGFHISLWHGFWVPKGTPKPIIAQAQRRGGRALADPATRGQARRAGRRFFRASSRRPRRSARSAKGRHREMVADHQGRKHQGGMSFVSNGNSKGDCHETHSPAISATRRRQQPLSPCR